LVVQRRNKYMFSSLETKEAAVEVAEVVGAAVAVEADPRVGLNVPAFEIPCDGQ
jgi:hypothetical protein